MRIALVITELDPGGAEQCLVHLAVFLQRLGHQVAVFALGKTSRQSLGDTPDREVLVRQLAAACIPVKFGDANTLFSLPRTVRWLRRELLDYSPDVIQSMLFHANITTSMASRGLSALHFGGERVREVGWMRGFLTRWASHRMAKVVCVSQSVADDCLRRLRIASQKLMIIPNGIELDIPESEFDEPLPFGSEARILLFVGRLSHQKGIIPLLQRTDLLLDDLPNYHLVILGDGPLKAQVRQIASDQAARSRIHILGWRPNIRQWIRRSDLVLIPSLFEGMPNVILEAMSQSRPVISFEVEGVRELLGTHANRQVAETENWSRFIQMAHQIMSDPALATQLGHANFLRVRTEFRLNDQLRKYEQLYLEAINRRVP